MSGKTSSEYITAEDIRNIPLTSFFYGYQKCPSRKSGLFGDDWTDTRMACELTAGPDADGKGFGYDECKFCGNDYRVCSIYSNNNRTKESGVVN
ncbi:MAG: hypothetical protein WCI72_06200 [archaeon]